MNVRMEEIKSGEMKNLSEHFNSMTDKINILIKHNQEVINEKNNFKMQILMAKLHPHFIFNALNTIKWMSVINHQENIQKLTEALIYILMNNAGDKKEDYSLKDEEELIKQYAVIQKARFMNFEIEWDLAGNSGLQDFSVSSAAGSRKCDCAWFPARNDQRRKGEDKQQDTQWNAGDRDYR